MARRPADKPAASAPAPATEPVAPEIPVENVAFEDADTPTIFPSDEVATLKDEVADLKEKLAAKEPKPAKHQNLQNLDYVPADSPEYKLLAKAGKGKAVDYVPGR